VPKAQPHLADIRPTGGKIIASPWGVLFQLYKDNQMKQHPKTLDQSETPTLFTHVDNRHSAVTAALQSR
jgi:hypothetical protein